MFYQLGYDKACKDIEAIIEDKYGKYGEVKYQNGFESGWCSALTAVLREVSSLTEGRIDDD